MYPKTFAQAINEPARASSRTPRPLLGGYPRCRRIRIWWRQLAWPRQIPARSRKAGLTGDEIAAARAGSSEDAKAAVAVKLARSLVEHKGDITTAELIEAREAGYSDADIVEIITHVGMNLLTNILGKASRVDIDFPKVSL